MFSRVQPLALQARCQARICSGSDLTASYFGPGRQRPSAAQLLDLVGAKAEDDETAGLVFCSRALLYAGVECGCWAVFDTHKGRAIY